MKTADPVECKGVITLVPVAVTRGVHADVSTSSSISGVLGHPQAPACSPLPLPLAFALRRHVPGAAFGGGWGSLTWTSVQCPRKNGISRAWKLIFLPLGRYIVTKLFPESSGEKPTPWFAASKDLCVVRAWMESDALGQC